VGTTNPGTSRSANGTYTETIIAGGTLQVWIQTISPTFVGDIDNVSVKQVNLPSSGDSAFNGTNNLLIDNNMEAAGTSAWGATNASILSKETSTPHGGSQLLRVTGGGTSTYGRATQNVMTTGKKYNISGWCRGDGSRAPLIAYYNGAWVLPTVGTTDTTWQYFERAIDGITSANIGFGLYNTTGYVDFDDTAITEINPLVATIPTSASGYRPTIGTDSTGGHLSNAFTFDGSNDYVNIYSSDLNSVFNPSEGTLVAWAKFTGSWTGGYSSLVTIQTDGNNRVIIWKNTADSRILMYYTAGGTGSNIAATSGSPTGWFQVAITWSKSADQVKAYFNGTQAGSTQTGLGTWIGNLSSLNAVIGATSTTATYPWSGDINDVRLYTRALSPEEISLMYSSTEDRQAYYTETYPGHELIRQYNTNISAGSLASEELAPGPVAYWKFDEGADNTCSGGTNDACDSTSNHNDGAFGASTAAPTWKPESECISGKCLYFDGDNDYIATTDIDITSGVTISAWVKTGETSNQQIVRKQSAYQLIIYDTGVIRGLIGNGSSFSAGDAADGTTVITDNKWHHVAMTHSDSADETKVYVDGKLETTKTVTTNLGTNDDTTNIGWAYSTYYFHGYIDEPKIYPFARTAAEIKSDYERGAAAAGSSVVLGAQDTDFLNKGLVGYWKMDETSGTTVADASGNGNTGTLTNAQESGTSDASGNSTTTLVDTDGSLSATDDAYNGMVLKFTATCGSIANNTKRLITDYDGTSKTLTVSSALAAAPDSCAYSILHQVGGKFGSGLVFGGDNDYVSTAYPGDLDSFSASVWVYFPTQSSYEDDEGIIAYSCTSSNCNFRLRRRNTASSTWRFEIWNESGTLSGTDSCLLTASPDKWNQITITYDQKTMKGYVNGQEKCTNDINLGPLQKTNANFYIGRRDTTYFFGKLDDVRVYNHALSAAEVAQLYSWAPGPLRYWKMDGKVIGDSKTIVDSSGNGGNGTTSDGANNSGMDCTQNGKIGTACEFDDIDDSISFSELTELTGPTTAFTESFWVKAKGYGAYHAILGGTWSRWNATYLGSATSFVYTAYNESDHLYSWIVSDYTNQWQHLAMVYSSETGYVTLYQNGISKGDKTILSFPSSGIKYIGSQSSGMGIFNGTIDDVKVYNYARTPAQILQDMGTSTASVLGTTSGGKPIPIAWYKFDEGQGQTAHATTPDKGSTLDATLGANSGSSTDDPTWNTSSSGSCKNQGCLYFDGTSDYTTSPYLFDPSTTDFSASAWFYTTQDPATNHNIISQTSGTGTGRGWLIVASSSGSYYLSTYFEGSFHNGSTPISSNQWHHAVITKSGTTVTFYLDGKFDKTDTITTESADGDMLFGTNVTATTNWFEGYLDDIKIYNFALTADQIKSDYNAGSNITMGSVQGVSEASTLSDGEGNPPVAEWKMDENTGTTIADTSGNGNTGTFGASTAAPTWTAGKIGPGLSFDGSNDKVQLDTPFDLGTTHTFETWFKPSTIISGYKAVLGGADTNNYALLIDDSTFLYKAQSNYVSTPFSVQPNTWYHYALVRSNTSVTYYLNGKQLDTDTLGSNSSLTVTTIGAISSSYSFPGIIDDMKIYNYARTPAQIAYDYNRGAPIAWYKMDECEGTTIHDASGNGNNGTLTIGAGGEDTVGTCQTSSTAWGNGASGKYSSAISLDGNDDYIDVADDTRLDLDSATSEITLSAWIKTSAANASIFGMRDSSGPNAVIDLELGFNGVNNADTGIPTFLVRDSNGSGLKYIIGTSAINDNSWHHVVATRNSSKNIKIYVDGSQVATDTDTMANAVSTDTVRIGDESRNTSITNFLGLLDDVRIYNYALSSTQVKKLYNENSSIRFGP